MKSKKESAVKTAKEPVFTKDALMNCKRFRDNRDLMSALLEDGVLYTLSEVKKKIAKYLKGKVN